MVVAVLLYRLGTADAMAHDTSLLQVLQAGLTTGRSATSPTMNLPRPAERAHGGAVRAYTPTRRRAARTR